MTEEFYLLPSTELDRLSEAVKLTAFLALGKREGTLFITGYNAALEDIRKNAPKAVMEEAS